MCAQLSFPWQGWLLGGIDHTHTPTHTNENPVNIQIKLRYQFRLYTPALAAFNNHFPEWRLTYTKDHFKLQRCLLKKTQHQLHATTCQSDEWVSQPTSIDFVFVLLSFEAAPLRSESQGMEMSHHLPHLMDTHTHTHILWLSLPLVPFGAV